MTRITMLDSMAARKLKEWLFEIDERFENGIMYSETMAAFLAEADENQGIVEIAARHTVTGRVETFNVWNVQPALTLDPVGLEQGVFTVMRDGNPICVLDMESYPAEIRDDERGDYDLLCFQAEDILAQKVS